MYRVFNMGHRIEIVCEPVVSAAIIDISGKFGIEARVVGRTEVGDGGVSLDVIAPGGTISYRKNG